MGTRERLAETKWGLFATGARAILNAGDVTSIRRAPSLATPGALVFCGRCRRRHSDARPRQRALRGAQQWLEIDGDRDDAYAIDARVPGAAQPRQSRGGDRGGARARHRAARRSSRAIPQIELPRGRYERIALPSDVVLIYDAYNANAAGMMAALDAFAAESAPRRIALLASMAELGEGAADLHGASAATPPRPRSTCCWSAANSRANLRSGARSAGLPSERIVPFMTNDQAARWLREHARAGDAVLLKGSRKYKLEEIVEELRR